MATTLRTALLILLFTLVIQMQFNLDADKTATRQLKNSIELAVHDAALAIDSASIIQGKIFFDQNLAIQNLKASLEANLNLTSNAGYVYTPNEGSFYQHEVYLLHLEFIDDSIPHTYPFTYINEDYNIMETVMGPSVVAVLSTESPKWFKGNQTYIRQASVYEYRK